MKPELRQTFIQTFQQLDRFSVPGIGTFRKERVPAKIDTFQKIAHPPAEHFLLEPGEHYVSLLTDHFFRSQRLNHGAAEALTREMGTGIRSEIESLGFFEIAGVGRLSKDRLYGYQLAAVNLDSPELYGLSPVAYKPLGVSHKTAGTVGKAKEKVIADRLEENNTIVEPLPPARKRVRIWPWVAVFLLIGIGVSAWFFWPQIETKLVAFGLFKTGPVYTDSTHPDKRDTTEMPLKDSVSPPDSAANAQLAVGKTPDQTAVKAPIKQPIVKQENNTLSDRIPDPSVASSPGTHYLVVASSHELYDAVSIAETYKSSKYQVKVLKPANDGWYRVSVFSGKDKMAVIKKMVEWKNDFPEKSWIFSR